MMRASCDYQIEFIRKKDIWSLQLRFLAKDKVVLTLDAHPWTAFAIAGHVLYYADYNAHSSGCAVVAYDLKGRKQLWKTNLKGLGPIDHTKYFNQVFLELVPGGAVRVWSQESAGDYLEYVDTETGKTVGHRLFRK
jgi:hypothetical protein